MTGIPKSLRVAFVVVMFVALTGAVAQGALVKIGPLILHADGGFTPTVLPKKKFAPIDFHGSAEVEREDGAAPPALEHAVLDFDRDGRLSSGGLAKCPAETIASATPEQARALCSGAIVGKGHLEGLVTLPGGGTIQTKSPLTIFNGPRLQGNPTVILHAQFTTPAVETFAVVVPIERKLGRYAYQAAIDVPPIAGGLGALTHVDVRIGRRYIAAGVKRSYVSARCGDGILETRGTFTFADGTVIAGNVDGFCRTR
ncbi:MAG TPA: hypothetical protein VII45_09040 [Solirubrobacterales bacterium]